MNPLDIFPSPIREALQWLAVIMPIALTMMHAFRRGADRLYEHALTTPEAWDDAPMRRLRNAVRWIDGWMLVVGRFIPGPPKASEVMPRLSFDGEHPAVIRARSELGDRGR